MDKFDIILIRLEVMFWLMFFLYTGLTVIYVQLWLLQDKKNES
jgi:phage shock protein PspC (stress-responsive transcriptional regulator)